MALKSLKKINHPPKQFLVFTVQVPCKKIYNNLVKSNVVANTVAAIIILSKKYLARHFCEDHFESETSSTLWIEAKCSAADTVSGSLSITEIFNDGNEA